MAYVIWRVFMKKYSKIRLGIQHRQLPVSTGEASDDRRAIERLTIEEELEVNPCDEPIPLGPPPGRWEEKADAAGPSTSCPSPSPSPAPDAAPADAAPADGHAPPSDPNSGGGGAGGGASRKSSKAKRVKSYLKKCKDAALHSIAAVAGQEEGVAEGEWDGDGVGESAAAPAAVQVRRRRRTSSKRRSDSGGRDAVSTTSWYVGADETPAPALPGRPVSSPPPDPLASQLKLGVEMFDEGAAEEEVLELPPLEEPELEELPPPAERAASPPVEAASASATTVMAAEATAAAQPLPPALDAVLDSRTEGGTPAYTVLDSPTEGRTPAFPELDTMLDSALDSLTESETPASRVLDTVLDSYTEGETPAPPSESLLRAAPELQLSFAVPGVVSDDADGDAEANECFFDARETVSSCAVSDSEPTAEDQPDDAAALVVASAATLQEPVTLPECALQLCASLGHPMDVASLAEQLLRPAYGAAAWARARPALVRQARDLLVTRFRGDLPRFQRRFLAPAAALLRRLRVATYAKGGDAVSVRGWPLTLGSRAAVALHLGELDPTLLRSRDCYLCVRPAQAQAQAPVQAEAAGVEVALVWRGAEGPPASRPLPAPRDLREETHPVTEEELMPAPASTPEPSSSSSSTTPSPTPSPELDSVLAMEEAAMLPLPDGAAAAGEQALPALLHTLLVSVERALERVPLDELAFPCPQCREACACACGAPPPAPVQKRDSSIQTSPMFEFAGPIPHIDSDEEDDGGDAAAAATATAAGAKATQTPSRAPSAAAAHAAKRPVPLAPAVVAAALATHARRVDSKACGADDPPDQLPEAPPPREIVAPRYISELSERLLFAGLQLPGTRDLRGRPIVLALAAELAAAAPEAHSLASLLLYYCSLLGSTEEEDLEAEGLDAVTSRKEVMLLVVSDSQETTALDILDRALALVQGRVAVGSVVVWRAQSQRGAGAGGGAGGGALRASQLRWAAATGPQALRALVAEEQAPAACGGRALHDHREWVDFHQELEPLWALSLACGRRLAGAMGAVRGAEGPPPPGRRRLHAQQRALARALADAELQRLRREGPATLQRLRERALCLPHSAAVRRSTERARRLWEEVDRAARRLEQLCEGRRERLRDLARVRALEEEAAQVLSWLCKKGEETLRRHTNLATNLSAIKEQEQDFEKFYFISMRHLDKGSDLLEEAAASAAPGAGPAAPGDAAPRSASSGGLRELARSLKQHLLGFSERLEDTRERLEDTSRCFCLLDKAYEWALETMKYMSRVKADDAQTPEQTLQQLTRLRQYLMAHPPVPDDHFQEMLALARKLANDKLLEQAKVAHARCQETMELIREQQARLVRTRQQLGLEDDEVPFSPSHGSPPPPSTPQAAAAAATTASDGARPASPRDAPLGCWSPAGAPPPPAGPAASSTPLAGGGGGSGAIGRRRSVGSFPYIYKCSHHAAGYACACWDSTLPPAGLEDSPAPAPAPGECTCGPRARPANNLGDIREVRESAEDLLEGADADAEAEDAGTGTGTAAAGEKGDGRVCGRCGGTAPGAQQLPGAAQQPAHTHKRYLRRSCTWQYPTEGFDEEDTLCEGGDGHIADSTTDGSDGCAKGSEDLEDQEGVANKSVPPVPVNSHLHCHASSLDLQASLQNASTKDLKIQKTLLLILREMIQTERDYVKSLEYVIENYIPELMREDIPQALRGQRNVIFGNIEKIFEFHSQYFLQELERCENSPLHVGQCFLRHEKKFYLYALYNKNKPKSDSLMSEYGSSFFKAKQLELGDKMDLASYLLKPVQRMGKYALLLQQLMKAYPEKEADVTDIKAAEQMVRFQLRHGNDLLAMDSLRDCDVNVKEQGRLLRQNEFLVWQGKGKKCLRQVFLFEELILFSKARRFPDRKNLDLYIYKNSIKMTDIGLTAKIGDSPTKFEIWFRKRKPNDTFTLQSMSEEIKQAWTEEISKLLWKQALRNREMRLAEMSSMGIGNKPCLDIRPSADQISDRSISIAQLSKTAPRFRNSISVSSGELLRSNKRPHSIISVSSSSSGGSSSSSTSHSSGSTYGALVNLGFDPADSPRMHHRSTTLHSQCSTESGIIADISLGSDDTDGCSPHWHVERSNSSVTSMSLDSSMSPTSPVSPSEENKTCLHPPQSKDDHCASRTNDNETDQEELSVKL